MGLDTTESHNKRSAQTSVRRPKKDKTLKFYSELGALPIHVEKKDFFKTEASFLSLISNFIPKIS